ncbi:MAG: universal stress protein [Myxococcota bacterium]|nr:universal stress protein [Myxococcota bacterium]
MTTQYRRILVPTDFSDNSRVALEQAVSLAQALGASIDLLHVWEPPRYIAPDLMLAVPGWSAVSLEQYSRAEAAKALEQYLQTLPPQVVLKSHLEVGDAAASIVRFAKEQGSDMIVMSTHGRGALSRLMLGSVAQKVVSHAECPVMTLRIPER